jgi:phage host-nuclease inhibitor protein Gam
VTADGPEDTILTPFTEATTPADPTTAESGKESERAEFHIDSDAAAEWLLRKLANIDAEQKRVQAQAATLVAQLEGDAQRLKHLYEGELLDYCRRMLAAKGNRRRSVTFLQGTVAFRTVAPSVKVSDQSAAVEYCQTAAPTLVRSVVTLDTAGYRDQAAKHFHETGNLLPGCASTPEHETHLLTFSGKE